MNPTDLIFQSLSQLTGGLITDLTTVIVGMVLLAFIAMGFDLILDVLDSRVQSFAQRKKLTGRFTEPGIDNRYTTNGKLSMGSREVPYYGSTHNSGPDLGRMDDDDTYFKKFRY